MTTAARSGCDPTWSGIGRYAAAVIDAKYKAEKPSGFPDADYYQLLAYATALHLHDAHLVYAKGNEIPRRFTVKKPAITIHAHTLDLNTEPDTLLSLVTAMATRIIATAALPAPARPLPLASI